MTIEILEKLIKNEMKSMKEKAKHFENWDYAMGYIAAISTLERVMSMLEMAFENLENGGCEDGEIN
jgi:hypothetical protein